MSLRVLAIGAPITSEGRFLTHPIEQPRHPADCLCWACTPQPQPDIFDDYKANEPAAMALLRRVARTVDTLSQEIKQMSESVSDKLDHVLADQTAMATEMDAIVSGIHDLQATIAAGGDMAAVSAKVDALVAADAALKAKVDGAAADVAVSPPPAAG